jgi:hypothetical protein
VAQDYEYPFNGHEAHPKFPVPFAGIEVRIVAENASGLAAMVRAIMRCDHGHNFAVEMDTSIREAGALWTSPTGAYCATGGKFGNPV